MKTDKYYIEIYFSSHVSQLKNMSEQFILDWKKGQEIYAKRLGA